MRLAAIPARHRMSALALLLSLFHSNCAQPTAEERARAVLEEAAEAMGGLEALEGIENITRKGSLQANALGQAHLASESLSIRASRPYTQIIDFAGSRQVSLTGQPGTAQVANLEKGGYRDVRGVALRAMASSLLRLYKKEWDRDIAKFLVHVLSEQGQVEGVEEAVLEGRSHQVVHPTAPGWHCLPGLCGRLHPPDLAVGLYRGPGTFWRREKGKELFRLSASRQGPASLLRCQEGHGSGDSDSRVV